MPVPLFPLPNVVLFPGIALPLYVFEPRYRTLLADVQASGEPFGIVRILVSSQESSAPFHERVSRTGTLAYLRAAELHEDGTSTIEVVGGERVQVTEFELSRPYLSAKLEVWPLAAPPAEDSGVQENAAKLLATLLRQRPAEAHAICQHAPQDALLLVSFLATFLNLDGEVKEAALNAPTLLNRTQVLLNALPDHTPLLN